MAQQLLERNARTGGRWTPYFFIAPAVVYMFLFQGYPLLQEFTLSFTETSLLSPNQSRFVGFGNYLQLLSTGDFRRTLMITALYTLASVVFSIGLGLATALLLNQQMRGRGIARALVTIPWAAPPVAVALVFSWMYNAQYGIFGHALRYLGFERLGSENWLDSPSLALTAVLLTTVWQIFPFSSVVFLAALQGVSPELREAAIIDKADRLNAYKAVVWPTIRPTVMLIALFTTIWSLRRFDLIWVLTQGGPVGATNTLVTELYRQGFVYRELGSAAAVGMVGIGISFIVTFAYFKVMQRAERARE
ncbi:multiple sugar transport system permease protein [Phyllobacterium trifolii]|uniref:Multiple sugar transport system permease protein n=1 Tax=Phyllobacterium trifolii TaxID=300193 RepID=A0A839UFZ5_9HYPH|nr:sugar ABC transporter permease [Phyllobacterium trifolii]MBB3148855.1 multiple sugar transport system permease protein [Phyllobacterium trifolii]